MGRLLFRRILNKNFGTKMKVPDGFLVSISLKPDRTNMLYLLLIAP